jgi:hypothetical protein
VEIQSLDLMKEPGIRWRGGGARFASALLISASISHVLQAVALLSVRIIGQKGRQHSRPATMPGPLISGNSEYLRQAHLT